MMICTFLGEWPICFDFDLGNKNLAKNQTGEAPWAEKSDDVTVATAKKKITK